MKTYRIKIVVIRFSPSAGVKGFFFFFFFKQPPPRVNGLPIGRGDMNIDDGDVSKSTVAWNFKGTNMSSNPWLD